jgi:tetratricopeptide (TPR) repeat protein
MLAQEAAKVGDIEKAEKTLLEAITLAEEKGIDPSWAHLNLAIIYEEAGRPADAQQHYQRTVDLQPGDPWFHYYYAQFAERQEQMDLALSEFRKAAEEADAGGLGRGWAFGNLGAFYKRRDMLEEARGAYLRAVHAEPKDSLLHANLADVYFSLGEAEQALQEYELALELDANQYFIYASYAGALYQLGEYKKAAEMYEKSLKLRPVDFPVLANLGQTYEAMGNVEKAIQTYSRMLELADLLPPQAAQIAQERLDALANSTP